MKWSATASITKPKPPVRWATEMKLDIQDKIRKLFELCDELTQITGRNCSPNGQQLGNLGEHLIVSLNNWELAKAGQKGWDAITKTGRKVSIKTITACGVGVNIANAMPTADDLLAIMLKHDGSFDILYNGPIMPAWEIRQKGRKGKQGFISMGPLLKLSARQTSPPRLV